MFFKGFLGVFASPRLHFSQFGEDIFVRNYFAGQKRGIFVDVGCFHPFYASNTARLFLGGWRGLSIDMDEKKIRLFHFCRPGDINVTAAVSDQSDQPVKVSRPRQTHGSYGSVDKLEFCEREESRLRTKTLTQLIEENNLPSVDFLSIDVEGHDFAVLSGLNFNKFVPRLICIEIQTKELSVILAGKINQHLSQNGYEIAAWYPPSVFFEQRPRREAVAA